MNIFYVHESPQIATRQICDLHVNKMIIESCQMMSTAHHVLGTAQNLELLMKPIHQNHPSSKWVRQSLCNYYWLYWYTIFLLSSYRYRTGKIHACQKRMEQLIHAPLGLNDIYGFTEPPKVMDDDLAVLDCDTITAYQLYLNRKYNEWMRREPPRRQLKINFVYGEPAWLNIDEST